MAIAALAIGNLSTPALYVASFHVEVFSDPGYTTLVSSQSCPAVKDASGNNWIQSQMISVTNLVRGAAYYIQAGPVSPGGIANFNRYSVVAGAITVPTSTYGGTFTSTTAGITYNITVTSPPTDIDHYEAIWTKDGSAPDNSSLINNWNGLPLPNGIIHLFVGGSPGETVHLFMRGVSTSGGYQNWDAVDNRTISAVSGGGGSTSAAGITYADGTTVEALKPGEAGADITSDHRSADTTAVNGINSGHVSDSATSVGFIGKWWRTSSGAVFPPAGGELPYAPMFTTHDAFINYNIFTYNTFVGSIASPSFAPFGPNNDGKWIYVRWTGYFTCSATGSYAFGTNSDDGANLYVNGTQLVHDLAGGHGANSNLTPQVSGSITLTAGEVYEIIVEYTNNAGGAGIQVVYTPPGTSGWQILNLGTAYKNANFMQYSDGTTVNALQPAAAGADVTAVNVSADTSAVGGRPAPDVANTVLAGGGIDYNHTGNINTPQNANNLLLRGNFDDGLLGSWVGDGAFSFISPVTGQPFSKALAVWNRDNFENNKWSVTPGQRIYISGFVNTMNLPAGWGTGSLGILFYDSSGAPLTFLPIGQVPEQTNWEAVGGYITVPANAVQGRAWLAINHAVGSVVNTAYLLVANLFYTKTAVVDFSETTHVNKNASNIPYMDGTPIQSLQPGQAGADVTAAQSIVYTGSSESIIPNGSFILGNMEGWFTNTFNYGMDGLGARIYSVAGGFAYSPSFAVVPGQKYRLSFNIYGNPGNGGDYLRLSYQPTYAPYIDPNVNLTYTDFLAAAQAPVFPTVLSYDWTCPAGMFYASVAIYAGATGGTSDLACKYVSCIPYAATAQWGADVTGSNTANNTNNVGTTPATAVSSTINPGGGVNFANPGNTNNTLDNIGDGTDRFAAAELGADNTLNHVVTAVAAENLNRIQIGSGFAGTPPVGNPCVYTVATFTVDVKDTSDVFNLQAVLQWEPNSAVPPFTGTPYAWLNAYVDAPAFVGTASLFGVSAPASGTYLTFGFGAASFGAFANVSFFGSVSGLSAGTHTISIVFNNHDTAHSPFLDYIYAICQQISS